MTSVVPAVATRQFTCTRSPIAYTNIPAEKNPPNLRAAIDVPSGKPADTLAAWAFVRISSDTGPRVEPDVDTKARPNGPN